MRYKVVPYLTSVNEALQQQFKWASYYCLLSSDTVYTCSKQWFSCYPFVPRTSGQSENLTQKMLNAESMVIP